MDREEFYRLKKVWHNIEIEFTPANYFKVANKKQRDTAAGDAEMAAKREKAKEDANDTHAGGADILGEQDDADIIF